jgi:hypothetical protein
VALLLLLFIACLSLLPFHYWLWVLADW